MTVQIGIMQGRLLPPRDGRIQSFPGDDWREEFSLAQQAGLACIEWIYEAPRLEANPVVSDEGLSEILSLSRASDVGICSICADYFMEKCLIHRDGTVDEAAVDHLFWLIGRGGKLGVHYIVLPFVDNSALSSVPEWSAMVQVLSSAAPAAAEASLELHLETSLPPRLFAALLEKIDHPNARVNYDTGNSAALGYDPAEELRLLGPWLGSVHIKDRVLGGTTVSLGTGDTDFDACFNGFRNAGFERWFILQAARGPNGGEVDLARANIEFVRELAAYEKLATV